MKDGKKETTLVKLSKLFQQNRYINKNRSFHFFAKNSLMKMRARKEQTRCRVASGEESLVLDFLFLLYQDKRKTHSC